MKRHSLGATKCLSVLLALASGAVLAGDQATGELQQQAAPAYTYSDDWAVVSAPPPQGPYNAINLDPRLPGQDLVAPMPMPEADTPEVPVTSAAASAPEGPASAPGASGSTSATASAPRQSSVPPQTPYDYQPQPAPQGQPAQVQDRREQHARMPGQPGPGFVQQPDTHAYGPAGFMNAPYPGAGRPANRPQPPVAREQQQRYENRPPPGYHRPQDYSQPVTRPMYGYPWPSQHPYPGYPAAGYSQSPWQGGDTHASEVEVPPPSVYNRMMAEPPPARYAPPPGRMEYYGGGR